MERPGALLDSFAAEDSSPGASPFLCVRFGTLLRLRLRLFWYLRSGTLLRLRCRLRIWPGRTRTAGGESPPPRLAPVHTRLHLLKPQLCCC